MTRRSKQTPGGDGKTVDIPCELIFETDRAWKCTVLPPGKNAKEREEWFPKSQCELKSKGMDDYLIVPEWLALEKGLI